MLATEATNQRVAAEATQAAHVTAQTAAQAKVDESTKVAVQLELDLDAMPIDHPSRPFLADRLDTVNAQLDQDRAPDLNGAAGKVAAG